jgi:hypothetical protein
MRTEAETKILIKKFEKDIKKRSWFMRLLLAFDQLGNVIFFNGSQDETISSHIGRTGKAKWLCKILRRLESKHCLKSRGE